MKKFLGILLGVMLCVGFTVPAMAEFDVTGSLEKTKTVTVDVGVEIEKDIDICVHVALLTPFGAEAEIVLNQANLEQEEIAPNCIFDNPSTIYDSITNSIHENTGIVGVNQAAGNMVNQANVVAAAVVWGQGYYLPEGIFVEGYPDYNYPYAEAQASAEQLSTDLNGIEIFTDTYNDLIDSVWDNYGIVGVNESAASLNNQINAVALAAGLDGVGVALAEVDLGQTVMYNHAFCFEAQKHDLIQSSINGNHGIVGVNQSSGYINNQANMVSISAAHPGFPQ